MGFKSFCNGSLWDSEVTWNTADPKFTQCFQSTILSWIPLLVWIILSPIQIILCKRSKHFKIPPNILNVSKIIFTICLVVCTISRFVYSSLEQSYTSRDVLGISAEVCSYCLSLAFIVVEMR